MIAAKKRWQHTSNLLVKHRVHALIALSFLFLTTEGSSRMNFVCFLGFDSANWTCEDVSRSLGQLLLGTSRLVEESDVVEYDPAIPYKERLALSNFSVLSERFPTTDEPRLPSRGKDGEIGLAEAVLGSNNVL